jgi:hypothetical protein
MLTPNSNVVPTPEFVFNRFDDPLKLFSVNYPSNFYVDKREINDSDITVTIIPKEFPPLSEIQTMKTSH